MVELAEEINTAAPLYVADRVRDLSTIDGHSVSGARVLLLGVTYKPNISDRRESPADPLARRLLAWGADLVYHDPHVASWQVRASEGPRQLNCIVDLDMELRTADVVVLLQPHREYDLKAISAAARRLLDTRGVAVESDTVTRL